MDLIKWTNFVLFEFEAYCILPPPLSTCFFPQRHLHMKRLNVQMEWSPVQNSSCVAKDVVDAVHSMTLGFPERLKIQNTLRELWIHEMYESSVGNSDDSIVQKWLAQSSLWMAYIWEISNVFLIYVKLANCKSRFCSEKITSIRTWSMGSWTCQARSLDTITSIWL